MAWTDDAVARHGDDTPNDAIHRPYQITTAEQEQRAMTQIDPIMSNWTVYRWVLKRAVLAMVAVALLALVA